MKLVKPQTYMNLSGSVLRPISSGKAGSAAQDLMVLVDEVAVPVGEYRLRAAGSPGGHNGLKSIEAHLKSPPIRACGLESSRLTSVVRSAISPTSCSTPCHAMNVPSWTTSRRA